MAEPLNGAELLARIKPTLREQGTEICLRPDLLDLWEEAQVELAESRTNDQGGSGSARLASGVSTKTRKLAQKVEDIQKQIGEASIMFRFRQMSQDHYQALCDQHPPRRGNDIDFAVGYNQAAVIDACIRLCLYDPVFDDESWAALLPFINPSEWDEMRGVVRTVNAAGGGTPKSQLASQILTRPGAGSRSRRSGTPAPESSTGG